jgi:putative nucleotidyltransferase with HDIG domain/PAS domain S-box-containing protein
LETEKLLLKTINIEDVPEIPTCAKIAISSALEGSRSIEELLHTVRESPSISLKILKVANSPIYRRERPVSNLKDAVVLLGYKTVKSIIISISIQELFEKKASNWFDHRRFFMHSLAVAILCEEFASRVGIDREEDLYAAGILHDIGKAILFLSDKAGYKKVVDMVAKENLSFREAEIKELGFDHTDAARFLLSYWEIPQHLIEAVCSHHLTDLGDQEVKHSDAAIVKIANEAAHIAGFDINPKERRYSSSLRIMEQLGILNEELDPIVHSMKKRIGAISEALNLQKIDLRGFFELISAANLELGQMWVKNQELLTKLKRKDALFLSLGRISDIALEERNLETALECSLREFCSFFHSRRATCELYINDDKSLVITLYRTDGREETDEGWELNREVGKRGSFETEKKSNAFRIQTKEGNALGIFYVEEDAAVPREELGAFLRQLALGLNNVKLFFTNKLKNERLNMIVNKLQEEMGRGKRIAEINRLVLENSPFGILCVDEKGSILLFNPQAEEELGEKLDDKNLFDLDIVSKSDLKSSLKNLMKGEKLVESLVEREEQRRSFSIEAAHIEGTNQTLLTVQDITDRKERERIAIQREKMATLGELAAGIAHNLRSPLAVAKGIPELILSELGSEDFKIVRTKNGKKVEKKEFRENMELISDSMVKALGVIDSIMEFAKHDFGTFAPVALSDAIEDARSLLNHRLRSKQINFINRTAQYIVQGNKNLLTQAFINLLNNSINAVETRGTIQVTCIKENERLVIRFEDDGKGIEEKNLDRIFEPFFTTSKKTNGTGIGLSITRKIVTMHGGSIAAVPHEGRGTIMELVIPTK